MRPAKKEHPKEKSKLHPRNKHRERYDFKLLVQACPELAPFAGRNAYNDISIDFFNPDAVRMLNKALLKQYYGISNWEIPAGYLCPPVPGRADYIHHIADLLADCNQGEIPTGNKIHCLDIGTGANCIYPLIGNAEYGWNFIGTDIDPLALGSAKKIVDSNPALKGAIGFRLQTRPNDIFAGIIRKDEKFDLTICNPPFHASPQEAEEASMRKLHNLTRGRIEKPELNFGGRQNELWFEGGEVKFIRIMIRQSLAFANSCFWFSTIVSKQSSLDILYEELEHAGVSDAKRIPMGQGNKSSRIIAWTFLDKEAQAKWIAGRWA